MRITLIHNPEAGGAEYSRAELAAMIRDAGHEVRCRSRRGDLRSAVRLPADLVVASGGDGTIAEVASLLAGSRTPMAMIPSGTANNIAWSLGIGDDPEELISRWKDGAAVRLHMGIVRGLRARRDFFESVGTGLFAELLHHKEIVDQSAKTRAGRLRSSVRCLLQLARAMEPQWWNVTLDGRDASGHYLMIEVMNIRSMGPNLQLAPSANPFDRFLDVVMVRADQRAELLQYLRSQLQQLGVPARFSSRRVRRVVLETDAGRLHVDDRSYQRRGAVRVQISVD